MRAFDGERVPAPVTPLIASEALDVGDRDLGGRGISLGIVPDEQLTVLFESDPCPRLGQRRNASCVGDRRTFSITAPTPVVERAGDRIALDGSVSEVATHVAAVCVENLDVALAVGEDDKAGAECLDLVGLTVAIGIAQSEAVPSTCEPCGRRCRFDFSNFLAGARLRRGVRSGEWAGSECHVFLRAASCDAPVM